MDRQISGFQVEIAEFEYGRFSDWLGQCQRHTDDHLLQIPVQPATRICPPQSCFWPRSNGPASHCHRHPCRRHPDGRPLCGVGPHLNLQLAAHPHHLVSHLVAMGQGRSCSLSPWPLSPIQVRVHDIARRRAGRSRLAWGTCIHAVSAVCWLTWTPPQLGYTALVRLRGAPPLFCSVLC